MKTCRSWICRLGPGLMVIGLLFHMAACGGEGGYDVTGDQCEVCPAGSMYDAQAGVCVCRTEGGCPDGLDLIEARCVDGSKCEAYTHRCMCVEDKACGEGYVCARGTGECMCAGDECCNDARSGYTYDPESYMCVCVSDECCRELGLGAHYDPVREMCVCSGDDSCPGGFRCDSGTAQCMCENDAACEALYGEDQFCNDFGFCQQTAGCYSTFDCRANQICDVATHGCIDSSSCTSNEQCPMGRICRAAEGRCSPGCDVTGDCELGQVCVDGVCTSGLCEDHSYCPIEYFCNSDTMSCYPGGKDYCRPCTSGFDCNVDEGEACLRLAVEGEGKFCAVECHPGADDCPSGYACSGSYTVCSLGNCPVGWRCEDVEILGEDEPVPLCVDAETGDLKPTDYHCAPWAGVCP